VNEAPGRAQTVHRRVVNPDKSDAPDIRRPVRGVPPVRKERPEGTRPPTLADLGLCRCIPVAAVATQRVDLFVNLV
jgi:hypothetical protein